MGNERSCAQNSAFQQLPSYFENSELNVEELEQIPAGSTKPFGVRVLAQS